MITGELMSGITDPDIRPRKDNVYDMCIDGDTLIIPRCGDKTVLYYRLNFDQ